MKAYFYLTIAAFLWGFNFHLLKRMFSEVSYMEAGFWRYLFCIIFLAMILFRSPPVLKQIKKNIAGILLVGFAGLFCFNVLLFLGLRNSTALNASLIMSLSPVFTLLLSSVFLKNKISRRQISGTGLSIAGVIYLLSKGNICAITSINISGGEFLILAACIISAFYHIWVKKYSADMQGQHFTLLTNIVCLLAFSVVVPFVLNSQKSSYSDAFWITAVASGVLGTAVTYLLWNRGVMIAGAADAGMFLNLVPLSAAVISLFTGEKITTVHFLAGVIILSGVLLAGSRKVA
jgi:drug/metabolite transporter (DMT)-like permease